MSVPMSPEREQEIRETGYVRPKARPGYTWVARTQAEGELAKQAEALDLARQELLAENASLRAELAKAEARVRAGIAADFATFGRRQDSLSSAEAYLIAREGLCRCRGGKVPCTEAGGPR